MLAIIETGGKQYTVKPDQYIHIEKLAGEPGIEVSFDKVLLYSDEATFLVGQPYLKNVLVSGKIVEQKQAEKVIVFKFKRKTGYKKKQGHRQQLTTVKIGSIQHQAAAKSKKSDSAEAKE